MKDDESRLDRSGAHLTSSAALSRPLAAAQRLGDAASDRHRFHKKRVLLTGHPDVLSTFNGRVMIENAMRLLVRICPNLTVDVRGAPESVAERLRCEAARIAFGPPISFVDEQTNEQAALTSKHTSVDNESDAVLTVGGRVPPGECWTSIHSDGWLAIVDSIGTSTRPQSAQANPMGALAAASLGVAEVWKRLIGLRPERGTPADGTPFSLLSYAAGSADPGPPLPNELPLNLLVCGLGAIGNGIVALLLDLPVRGKVVLVDRQKFGPENLGTCLLIGPADVRREKAQVMTNQLLSREGGLEAVPLCGEVAVLLPQIEREMPDGPCIVISGLDNRDARRVVQQLWADATIDGAIGDLMTQVSVHPGDPDVNVACLRCLYAPDAGPNAELVASRATGLSVKRVRDADDVVREEDVRNAPLEQREYLRSQLGKKICAVTSAAVAAAISTEAQEENFEPSVPFVATMSAAMCVAEGVKRLMGIPSPLEPRFQFDILHGPGFGLFFPEPRRRLCDCVARRAVITGYRRRRQGTLAIPSDA